MIGPPRVSRAQCFCHTSHKSTQCPSVARLSSPRGNLPGSYPPRRHKPPGYGEFSAGSSKDGKSPSMNILHPTILSFFLPSCLFLSSLLFHDSMLARSPSRTLHGAIRSSKSGVVYYFRLTQKKGDMCFARWEKFIFYFKKQYPLKILHHRAKSVAQD